MLRESLLGESLLALLALLLAVAMGFAIRRGSVCLVEASAQWIVRGRTRRIRAFIVAGAVAGSAILPLAWLLPGDGHLAQGFPVMLPTLLWAGAFGLGARLNGGCTFGTINRLGGGDLPFLATLFGAAGGAILAMGQLDRARGMASPLMQPDAAGLAALAVLVLLAAPALRRRHLANLRLVFSRRAKRLRPFSAMLAVGVLGGLLYAFAGSWTPFSVLAREGSHATGLAMDMTETKALAGGLAVIGGSLFAALLSGRFALRLGTAGQWLRCAAGGATMGAASAAIPGGNSALLVYGMPSGAANAWAAYAAMMVVLVLSFLPMRRRPQAEGGRA